MFTSPILAFDIETIPDANAIRLLNDLPEHLSDTDVVEFAMQQRRAKTGSDFMQHHLHKVVAISCCLRRGDAIRIGSIGTENDSEADIIQKFFDTIKNITPQLVSWNGSGFDLPVLHYRALMHGISAPRYWDMGEGDFQDSSSFKWNNYISRYHNRHCDLMDLLALYNPRANVPLDDMAKLCGFPGKMGMDGSKVWQAYQEGKIKEIRDYCETDAANTFLVFQRFRLMNGSLNQKEYQEEIDKVRHYLQGEQQNLTHWQEFLAKWPSP